MEILEIGIIDINVLEREARKTVGTFACYSKALATTTDNDIFLAVSRKILIKLAEETLDLYGLFYLLESVILCKVEDIYETYEKNHDRLSSPTHLQRQLQLLKNNSVDLATDLKGLSRDMMEQVLQHAKTVKTMRQIYIKHKLVQAEIKKLKEDKSIFLNRLPSPNTSIFDVQVHPMLILNKMATIQRDIDQLETLMTSMEEQHAKLSDEEFMTRNSIKKMSEHLHRACIDAIGQCIGNGIDSLRSVLDCEELKYKALDGVFQTINCIDCEEIARKLTENCAIKYMFSDKEGYTLERSRHDFSSMSELGQLVFDDPPSSSCIPESIVQLRSLPATSTAENVGKLRGCRISSRFPITNDGLYERFGKFTTAAELITNFANSDIPGFIHRKNSRKIHCTLSSSLKDSRIGFGYIKKPLGGRCWGFFVKC